jgi:hypothetical protein
MTIATKALRPESHHNHQSTGGNIVKSTILPLLAIRA